MSSEITTAQKIQFGNNIALLAQQKASRLRPAVLVEPGVSGKSFTKDQVGSTAAKKMTTRHADTPLMNTPHRRRFITMADYNWADLVDTADKLKTIADPTNPYAQAGGAALGRAMDDVIIAAAFATAATGEDGSTSVAFPAANVVAVDSWAYGTGSGNAGLTVSKLISAKVLLDAAEAGVDPDEERYIAVTAKQLGNLLATTQATSEDYVNVKALVEGRIDQLLGFRFIRIERLQTDANNHRRVPAWVKSGLCLGIGLEPVTKIDQRPDKNYSTQVYAEMSLGAGRIEEAKVVEIKCAE